MWYNVRRRFISSEGTFRPGDRAWIPIPRRAAQLISKGLITSGEEAAPAKMVGEWSGETVAIFAGGPSLTQADVDRCIQQGWKRIAVNTSYRADPGADVLYACDYKWWAVHAVETSSLKSRRITRDTKAAAEFGIEYIPSDNSPGLSKKPGVINEGGNSGYQAIGLAHHLGASRIILLGFDMGRASDGKTHWFGSHPGRLEVASPYDLWIRKFADLAKDLEAAGVQVINASRDTRLEAFPRATLDEILSNAPALFVAGMHGLGDNLHQRAFIREAIKTQDVYLETPWPNVYHDLRGPRLHILQKGSRLRTQAKNISRERTDFDRIDPPRGARAVSVRYLPEAVRREGSVLAAMMRTVGTPDARDFRLPVPWDHGLGISTDRPIMLFRPLQERTEWTGCANRNPKTEDYVELFKSVRDRFFVVSVADFEDGREWCPHEDLEADLKFHKGELSFPQIAALAKASAVVFTPPGFAAILAQAVGTPVVCTFGGYENASSFSGGEAFARCLWIEPRHPCQCFSHSHACRKDIDLPDALSKLKGFIDAIL